MSVCSLHFAYVVDKTAKGFFFYNPRVTRQGNLMSPSLFTIWEKLRVG